MFSLCCVLMNRYDLQGKLGNVHKVWHLLDLISPQHICDNLLD